MFSTREEIGGTSRQRSDAGVRDKSDTVSRGTELEATAVRQFREAQGRLLNRFGVRARSRFLVVPAIGGRAHVLETGDGPPVLMVIGGTVPAAMWAPLMPELDGFTLYAVDLPGFGLTDTVRFDTRTMRSLTVEFLDQVLRGLGLERALFVTQSMGSLWTTWLAVDKPERVAAMVQIACTAFILGTTAPLAMRLFSVPSVGRLLLRLQPPSPKQVDRVAAMVQEDFSKTPELRDALLACEKLPAYGLALIGLMHATLRLRGTRPAVALAAEQLARITQPVQMIWGTRDPFGSPDVAERAAAIIPAAELHIVPGGHAPWFAHAEKVGALARRFLLENSTNAKYQLRT